MPAKPVHETVVELQKALAVVEERVDHLRRELDKLAPLIHQVAVLEDRVNDLKRAKEEAEKRYWQFVVLFVGGLVTLGINLVVSFIRR